MVPSGETTIKIHIPLAKSSQTLRDQRNQKSGYNMKVQTDD